MAMEEEVMSDFAAAILESTEDLSYPRIGCGETVVASGEAKNLCGFAPKGTRDFVWSVAEAIGSGLNAFLSGC
jgi:hypothetical protein